MANGVMRAWDGVAWQTLPAAAPNPGAIAQAINVGFAPAGTISSTNVQAALQELDGDIQAGINFTQGGSGAVLRTAQSKLRESISIFDFGAVEGADIFLALSRAVAYAKTKGGGRVYVPASAQKYLLSNEIWVDSDDIHIYGDGHGDGHDTGSGNNASTIIQWSGANGATTMFRYQPANAATRALKGSGLKDIMLEVGTGANRGVLCLSASDGEYDFAGHEFLVGLMEMGCIATLSEASDCQRNEVSLLGRQVINAGSILIADGISNANTSFNVFKIIKGVYGNNGSPAVWLKSTDNNIFQTVHLVRGSGTGIGVLLDASPFSVPAASNMFINLSPGNGGVYAAGTERGPNPSVYNSILYYDKGNGPPDPVSGNGAVLYWGSNFQAGIARRKDVLGNVNWYVDSFGRFHVYGLTGTIGANSTGSFTLPAGVNVTTGIQSIQLTARTNSVTKYSTQWTGSQVNINNGDPSISTDFYYHVTGF